MLDIIHLEEAWKDYQQARETGSLTDWGLINITSWMGERMGSVLAEVRRLREQLKPGTATVFVRDGEFSEVMDLPPDWDYKVEEDPQ